MVLTIDGIQRMNHNIFCDREIVKIESANHFGTKHYVFHFDCLPGYQPGPFPTWEDRFAIHFVREPKNGSYELYWMGLHGVTCQFLDIEDIKNFSAFYNHFVKVVQLGKMYWDESKTYRI
jgi:hypothetical protein